MQAAIFLFDCNLTVDSFITIFAYYLILSKPIYSKIELLQCISLLTHSRQRYFLTLPHCLFRVLPKFLMNCF